MRTAEKIEGRKCPYCGRTEQQIKLGTTKAGSVRHKCKVCGKVYIPEKKSRGYSEETKQQAIKAYYSGLSARQVGKMFGMNKANVLNWIKKPQGVWISPNTRNDNSQMDELFWFIKRSERTKTKENTYVILLISTSPRQILGYYAGKYRNAEVMQRIADEAPSAKVYCTDGNFTYKNVIFPGKHIQNNEDKSDTHDVESINADLRTYISGLRRRSRCFYRSYETLDAVISLFIDAYNKFGEAKSKRQIPVVHKPGNENKHLHKYRDVPFSLLDFL